MGRQNPDNFFLNEEDALLKSAQQWITDYTENNTGATYSFTEDRAREFSQTPIETLIRDPYFLGFEEKVYDGVLEDILSLFEARQRGPVNTAVFLEGIGCLSGEKSWLWTSTGLTQLSEINENLVTVGLNSNREIIGKKSELKPSFRITTRSGLEIECSSKHPLWTLGINGIPDWSQISLGLKVGDFIGVKIGDQFFGQRKRPKDICWLLGMLVGDGSLTQHSMKISSHNEDVNLLERIQNILKEHFSCDSILTLDSRGKENTHLRTRRDSILKEFLKSEGILGKDSFEKTVPLSILKGTKENWSAFLQGYFDADGSVDKRGNIRISSVSKLLLQQVQYALLNFGIICSIGKKKTSWNHNGETRKSMCWRLKISGEETVQFFKEIGFSLERKQVRSSFKEDIVFNTNVNLLPNISSMLYTVWAASGLTQKGFKSIINSNYHQSPSKNKLKRFLEHYKNSKTENLPEFQELTKRANESIFWDPIINIEELEPQVLTDIAVDTENTYIANGLIHHNSGKTVKASILMWLLWYELSMIPDPQNFYHLAPRSVIALMMFSRSESQSRRITFGEVWNRFQCPFNKDYFPPSPRFNREIRIDVNNTCVFAGSSSALSALGYNLFGGIIDEASFLEVVEDSKKANAEKFDAAEEMFNAVMNRMISRFLYQGRLPGLLCMVTSPRFPNDFIHRKIDEAVKLGETSGIFWRRRSTWEAKGKKYYPQEDAFFIDTESSEVLKDPIIEKMLNYIDESHFPLECDTEKLYKLSRFFEPKREKI